MRPCTRSLPGIFQSTLPVRGATSQNGNLTLGWKLSFQSTLPVRGATHTGIIFSPINAFQSTLPVRGATTMGDPMQYGFVISIHAPREGSDQGSIIFVVALQDFNPRSP